MHMCFFVFGLDVFRLLHFFLFLYVQLIEMDHVVDHVFISTAVNRAKAITKLYCAEQYIFEVFMFARSLLRPGNALLHTLFPANTSLFPRIITLLDVSGDPQLSTHSRGSILNDTFNVRVHVDILRGPTSSSLIMSTMNDFALSPGDASSEYLRVSIMEQISVDPLYWPETSTRSLHVTVLTGSPETGIGDFLRHYVCDLTYGEQAFTTGDGVPFQHIGTIQSMKWSGAYMSDWRGGRRIYDQLSINERRVLMQDVDAEHDVDFRKVVVTVQQVERHNRADKSNTGLIVRLTDDDQNWKNVLHGALQKSLNNSYGSGRFLPWTGPYYRYRLQPFGGLFGVLDGRTVRRFGVKSTDPIFKRSWQTSPFLLLLDSDDAVYTSRRFKDNQTNDDLHFLFLVSVDDVNDVDENNVKVIGIQRWYDEQPTYEMLGPYNIHLSEEANTKGEVPSNDDDEDNKDDKDDEYLD